MPNPTKRTSGDARFISSTTFLLSSPLSGNIRDATCIFSPGYRSRRTAAALPQQALVLPGNRPTAPPVSMNPAQIPHPVRQHVRGGAASKHPRGNPHPSPSPVGHEARLIISRNAASVRARFTAWTLNVGKELDCRCGTPERIDRSSPVLSISSTRTSSTRRSS